MNLIAQLAVARRGLILALTVFVAAPAAFFGAGVRQHLVNGGFRGPSSESTGVDDALARDFHTGAPNLVVIASGRGGRALDGPAVTDAANGLVARIRGFDGVVSAGSYWTSGRPESLRSKDGTSGLILVRLGGNEGTYQATARRIVPRIGDDRPALRFTGSAQAHGEVEQVPAGDLLLAEGLGLAIGYNLFVISRFRDELAAGAGAAVRTAVRTAGGTVLFSGVTVALPLSALLVFPLYFFRSVVYDGIAVVLVAALIPVIALPAFLALLGRRVNRFDVFGRFRRRPERVLAAAGAGGDAAPGPGHDRDRHAPAAGKPVPVGFVQPGLRPGPARLVTGPPVGPVPQGELRRGGEQPDSGPAPRGGRCRSRENASPYAAGPSKLPGFSRVDTLTGSYAGGRLPLALSVIVVTTFVLLFLLTGSVLIPVRAIVLNLLSLTAAFGVMVYVFQDGHLEWLVGEFETTGMIDAAMPVLMFCIAFGLSMNYEVFLLSRIREEYLRSSDNTRSVALGLEKTGRVMTAGAVLIGTVFVTFASSGLTLLKLLGAGLALAVVVDATLVRGLLVPAFMRLAGRANGWVPGPLRRLRDRFGLSGEAGQVPETSRTTAGKGRDVEAVKSMV